MTQYRDSTWLMVTMSMYNSKDSQLELTNSSDSNCVGRQNSNDKRRNTTLDYLEGSTGNVWEQLNVVTNYVATRILS